VIHFEEVILSEEILKGYFGFNNSKGLGLLIKLTEAFLNSFAGDGSSIEFFFRYSDLILGSERVKVLGFVSNER